MDAGLCDDLVGSDHRAIRCKLWLCARLKKNVDTRAKLIRLECSYLDDEDTKSRFCARVSTIGSRVSFLVSPRIPGRLSSGVARAARCTATGKTKARVRQNTPRRDVTTPCLRHYHSHASRYALLLPGIQRGCGLVSPRIPALRRHFRRPAAAAAAGYVHSAVAGAFGVAGPSVVGRRGRRPSAVGLGLASARALSLALALSPDGRRPRRPTADGPATSNAHATALCT